MLVTYLANWQRKWCPNRSVQSTIVNNFMNLMIWAIYGQNRRKGWKGASKFQGKLLEQYHWDELFHTSVLTFFWPLWQVLRHNALRKVNSSKNLTVNVALRIFYQSTGTSWILKKSDQATARCSTPQVAFSQWGSSWIWPPSHIAYQTRLIPCPCRKYFRSLEAAQELKYTYIMLILMTEDSVHKRLGFT